MQITDLKMSTAEILKTYLDRKKTKNGGYSLRALARDLGKSPSYMSQVLSGHRRLSADLYADLADKLELDGMARRNLSLSVINESDLPTEVKEDLKLSLDKVDAEEEYSRYEESAYLEFDILRHWYCVAILDLPSLSNFEPSIGWISKFLNISPYEAETTVQKLFSLGLLKEENGCWIKAKFKLRFSSTSSKTSIRLFHQQMMEKAIVELRTQTTDESFQRRLITGVTLATNPNNVKRAQQRMNEMLFELSEILTAGECTELYHIGAQLFPIARQYKK